MTTLIFGKSGNEDGLGAGNRPSVAFGRKSQQLGAEKAPRPGHWACLAGRPGPGARAPQGWTLMQCVDAHAGVPCC